MGSIIKNAQTIIKERTIDGEITINLVLTIKVENGDVSISTEQSKATQNLSFEKINDKLEIEIPDFNNDKEIINFGKKV